MKGSYRIFSVCFVSMLLILGCKKGEEDPTLSLRTRKERFAGDWNLTRGFVSSTSKNSVVNTSYTASAYTTTTSLNPDLVINGSYTKTLSINKEGTFIEETYKDNQYTKDQGYWTFLSGNDIEKLKNKEAVLFKIASQFNSVGNILNQFEGEERPLATIRLKKLANKEMVWTINGIVDEQITEGELTWTLR
jgi:hypothetical protein